jgi:Mrp family chromosome partitioning ATPase/capsular polysaccharide biosynthesis protein
MHGFQLFRARVFAWILCCISVAMIYVLFATPEFAGYSQILLEARRPAFVTSNDVGFQQLNLDSPQIESQIQTIRSERVLRAMIDEMNLASDPEFSAPPRSVLAYVMDLFVNGSAEPEKPSVPVTVLADKIVVRRLGQSLALEISVRATSPARAIQLSNSVTAAYLYDQISSKLLDTRRQERDLGFEGRAGNPLQSRIADIEQQQAIALEALRSGSGITAPLPAADTKILSNATPPARKAFPQTTLILLFSVAFALLSAFAALIVRTTIDQRLWTKRDVPGTLSLPCLAAFPRQQRAGGTITGSKVAPDQVVRDPWSDFADRFRSLYNAIFNSPTRPSCIGVASVVGGEGGTAVTSNLAFTAAASGRKVILVDADMREHSLSSELKSRSAYSISDIVNGSVSPEALFDDASSITVVPALRQNEKADPFLFSNLAPFRAFLARLGPEYVVIVDMPAIRITSDSFALATALDGIVIVAQAGRTKVSHVATAVEEIRQTRGRVLGVVLNKTAKRTR